MELPHQLTLENCTDRDAVLARQENNIFIQEHLKKVVKKITEKACRIKSPLFPSRNLQLQLNDRVNIQDLRESITSGNFSGKYFLCRTITPPFTSMKDFSITVTVEDPEGVNAIQLSLYTSIQWNITDDLTKVLPLGSILVIMCPRFKSTRDEGFILQCDNPADINYIENSSFTTFFPDLSWRGTIHEKYRCFQEDSFVSYCDGNSEIIPSSKFNFQRLGNEYFVKKKYLAALRAYNSYLNILDGNKTDVEVLSNRAAVFLRLSLFSLALKDTEMILYENPRHFKAIYRKSKALCGLGKLSEAGQFLNQQMGQCSENATRNMLQAELKKITTMEDQRLGNYNILELLEESKQFSRLEDMIEFQGPIEIVPTAEKGRGVILSRNVKAGELILASRAFEVIFPNSMNESDEGIPLELKSDDFADYSSNHMELAFKIVQKLSHDPESGKQLDDLYSGPVDKLKDTNLSLLFDIERIESIIRYNSFGFGGPEKEIWEQDSEFGIGLWILSSFINHSCFDCNASYTMYGDFMFVRAVKDISKGEELTTSYASPYDNLDKRTKIMKENFGFVCNCSLCNFQRKESFENAQLVKNITEFVGTIKNVEDYTEMYGKWLKQQIFTLKNIRSNDKLNLNLVTLHQQMSLFYFKNDDYNQSIEELKKAHAIVDGTVLSGCAASMAYTIVLTYLLQGGRINIKRAKQWIAKMKYNFTVTHGSLDVLRNKRGSRPGQNFESLLIENGIKL